MSRHLTDSTRARQCRDPGGLLRSVWKAAARRAARFALVFIVPLWTSGTAGLAQSPIVTPGRAHGESEVSAAGPNTTEWFRIEFSGKHAGYESLCSAIVPPADEGAPPLTIRSRTTRLHVKRLSAPMTLAADLRTTETADGRLVSWSLKRTDADSGFVERSGTWEPAERCFVVTEQTGAQRRTRRTDVGDQPRSPLITSWLVTAAGSETNLWSTPVLFPETGGVADIRISFVGTQSLAREAAGRVNVRRWEYWPVDDPDRRSVALFDEQGQCVQVEQPLFGDSLKWIRADAASALGKETLAELDLQLQTAIAVRRPPALRDATSVRWRIRSTTGERIALPNSDFQSVEFIAPDELIVTVRRPELPKPQTVSAGIRESRQAGEELRTPSRWIDSDNPEIRRAAALASGGTSLVDARCERLARFVREELRFSQFSTGLSPASEVLRNRRGDCTEHAVLLAALLRSENVPARVAVGFVYVPRPESFMPHMWVEAFVDGVWMPLDSTRGLSDAGLDLLKVADSPLSDDIGAGVVLFVPLLDLVGRVTVEALPADGL